MTPDTVASWSHHQGRHIIEKLTGDGLAKIENRDLPRERLPRAAAILLYVSRASLGIGIGASIVLFFYVVSQPEGHPIVSHGMNRSASYVAVAGFAFWFVCVLVARILDRKYGL